LVIHGAETPLSRQRFLDLLLRRGGRERFLDLLVG
jgi:hypothetical protein